MRTAYDTLECARGADAAAVCNVWRKKQARERAAAKTSGLLTCELDSSLFVDTRARPRASVVAE